MIDVEIGPAQPADLPSILRIADACKGLPHWTPQAFESLLKEQTSGIARVVLLAKTAREAVAFGVIATVLAPPVFESEVESLAVHPQWRRHGIGRSVLAALLANAGSRGEGVVRLEVRASNAGAIALYNALGFHQVGTRAEYYRQPVEDAVLLERFLDGTFEAHSTASGIISATYGS